MQSKNEKTDVAEEQAQNPEQITKTQIAFGDPASAGIVAADEINRFHYELKDAFRTGIEKAIRIGELLTKQKAQCTHGEWLPWLKANVKFSVKTAYNYERVYQERSNFVNITNLAEAYRLLKRIRSHPSRTRLKKSLNFTISVTPRPSVAQTRKTPERNRSCSRASMTTWSNETVVSHRPSAPAASGLTALLNRG